MIYDFHNWRHADAINEVHRVVSEVRLSNSERTVEFITGWGSIRNDLIEVLKNYGLEPHSKFGNSGIIVVTIY